MATILTLIGGAIIAMLGTVHGVYTWRDQHRPRVLVPRDPALIDAMKGARLAIAPDTDLWRAWIGFNFSHALGAVLFGGGLMIGALAYPDALHTPVVRIGAPVIAGLYLVMSVRYWFRIPSIAIASALGLITLGALLI